MNNKPQYYVYHDGELYRVRCMTSEPIEPSVVIYAIAIKLGDFENNAVMLEKGQQGIKCYGQISPCRPYHQGISELERDRIIHTIKDIDAKQAQKLPAIWVVELYNNSFMAIPEADMNNSTG